MSYRGAALLCAVLLQAPCAFAAEGFFFKALSGIKSSFEKPAFVRIRIHKPKEDYVSFQGLETRLSASARKNQGDWFFQGDLRFTARPIFMGDPDYGYSFWDHETNARHERWGAGYNIRGTYKNREIDFRLDYLWDNEYEVHSEGADLRTYQTLNGLVLEGRVNPEKFTQAHLELLSATLAILYDPKIGGRPQP